MTSGKCLMGKYKIRSYVWRGCSNIPGAAGIAQANNDFAQLIGQDHISISRAIRLLRHLRRVALLLF